MGRFVPPSARGSTGAPCAAVAAQRSAEALLLPPDVDGVVAAAGRTLAQHLFMKTSRQIQAAGGFPLHARDCLSLYNEALAAEPGRRTVLSVCSVDAGAGRRPAAVARTAGDEDAPALLAGFSPWMDFGLDHVDLYLLKSSSTDKEGGEEEQSVNQQVRVPYSRLRTVQDLPPASAATRSSSGPTGEAAAAPLSPTLGLSIRVRPLSEPAAEDEEGLTDVETLLPAYQAGNDSHWLWLPMCAADLRRVASFVLPRLRALNPRVPIEVGLTAAAAIAAASSGGGTHSLTANTGQGAGRAAVDSDRRMMPPPPSAVGGGRKVSAAVQLCIPARSAMGQAVCSQLSEPESAPPAAGVQLPQVLPPAAAQQKRLVRAEGRNEGGAAFFLSLMQAAY